MTLSDISIKNPVFAWMLMVALMFFGVISFRTLGISQMPDVDFPVINISLTLNGASPEIMETNVVDVVEESLLNIEGIVNITSSSGYGAANVTVELDISRNVDAALQEIQTKVLQAQKLLPKELDSPVISKYNPEEQPILWVAVSYSGEKKELMSFVKDRLKNKLSVVPGVGQIMLGGYVDRSLRVWVNSEKLHSNELTVEDVISSIQKEHIEVPAGLLENQKQQINIRALGEARSVPIFESIPVIARGGSPVLGTTKLKLKDIATIEDGLDDIYRLSRLDGKSAVGMGIIKQRGVNAVKVAEDVKAKLEEIKKDLPKGYDIGISFDTTKFIKESIEELEFNLVLSAFLTSIVTWLFLGSITSTINILLAIPTSILGTFIFLDWMNFTLNTFTLLALSLAVGIVVDDAIMVLENIVRHKEDGETTMNAAKKGARQITFAAIAATFSIVAIFLPVAFMKGIIGKYFYQFGVTITAAVMLSLLESLTLTPMRCSQLPGLGNQSGKFYQYIDRFFSSFDLFYEKVLRVVVNWKYTVLILSTAIFASSFLLFKPLKKEFSPSQDQSQVIIRMQTPPGSSMQYTDGFARKCEEILLKNKNVTRVFSAVGSMGRGGSSSNSGMFFVTLLPPDKRETNPETKKNLTQADISKALRKDLSAVSKELKIIIQDMSMRGFSSSRGFPIEFIIQGGNWEALSKSSLEIVESMKKSGKFVDVDSNFQPGQPEIQIFPDREKALLYGVTVSSIGTVINAMIGGYKAGQFTDGGRRYYINVRLKEDYRKDIESIQNLYVRNNRGELVSLSKLITVKESYALQTITRVSRERAITIYANPAPGVSQEIALKDAEVIGRSKLPEGFSLEFSGSAKTMGESFQSLFYALVLGIIIAYMILASQFGSYIHPITVLLALPFSFTGAIVALYLTGNSLNMYSFIALILLMGLVKKNSIILVDFTNHIRSKGVPVKEAVLQACPVRLRPILMTSISTIAAAIPPALSIGPGGEVRIPMAIAIIGGITVSTLLTLVVIPCAYIVLSKVESTKGK